GELHHWLSGQPAPPDGSAPALPTGGLDLATLLREFTALRHEVNLQTKAARAQLEQNAEALRQAQELLDSLERARQEGDRRRQADLDEKLRPLLKTLTELYDALSLAGRETQRLHETLSARASGPEAAPADGVGPEPELPAVGRPPWWARWLGARAPKAALDQWRGWHVARLEQERAGRVAVERRLAEVAERLSKALASLVAGYAMSLQRLERAMRQHGLEAMEVVGQPFDPEQMEVLEAVPDSGRPSGEVLEEVR